MSQTLLFIILSFRKVPIPLLVSNLKFYKNIFNSFKKRSHVLA